jgi:hypothetical protein
MQERVAPLFWFAALAGSALPAALCSFTAQMFARSLLTLTDQGSEFNYVETDAPGALTRTQHIRHPDQEGACGPAFLQAQGSLRAVLYSRLGC